MLVASIPVIGITALLLSRSFGKPSSPVNSVQPTAAVNRTDLPAPLYETINDAELERLLADRSVLLVRHEQSITEVIFLEN